MSWHYLRERGADYSVECSPDLKQFALLKLTTIAGESYSRDKMRGYSHYSRFGTTLEPLRENPGVEKSTSLPADSLVRTLALVDAGQEYTGNGPVWFGKCCELLKRFGLVLSSPKTARICEHVGSIKFSKRLPAWGMMLDGVCWGLGTSARPIEEIGCGYWQTPVADDSVNRKKGKFNNRGEPKLSAQVLMLPTPTAHNAKEWNSPAESTRNTPTLAARVGGRLNPTWVEWLMGWPTGWTDLEPLETVKFLEWLASHGRF